MLSCEDACCDDGVGGTGGAGGVLSCDDAGCEGGPGSTGGGESCDGGAESGGCELMLCITKADSLFFFGSRYFQMTALRLLRFLLRLLLLVAAVVVIDDCLLYICVFCSVLEFTFNFMFGTCRYK